MEQEVIGLACHLVDAVDIGRAQRMCLVDRQIARPPVYLPRPGMDDRDPRGYRPAQFEQLQLRHAIDREVVFRRGHRVHVAGLGGEIEQEILPRQQMAQRLAVADIGDVDPQPVADIGDVGEIAPGLGHHAVEQQHLGAERDEPARQRGADQTHAAGNHHPLAAVGGKARIVCVVHIPSLSGDSRLTTDRFLSIC